MAIFHELDLVKFSEFFSVNFDELRHSPIYGGGARRAEGALAKAAQTVLPLIAKAAMKPGGL